MKPSASHLLRASAIGCVISALFLIGASVYHHLTAYRFMWFTELVSRGCMGITMLSIAAACFVFYAMRHQRLVLSRKMRIFTYVLTGLYIVSALLVRCYHSFRFVLAFLDNRWVAVLFLVMAVWLWLMSRQPQEDKPLPKSLATLLLAGMVLPLINLLLMCVSCVAYLCVGHLFCLNTFGMLSWLRIFIPLVLLILYSCHLIRSQRGKSAKHPVLQQVFAWIFGLACIMALIIAAVCMRVPSHHESTQTILEEEMQQTVNANSPKWAGALVLDVPSGVVIATYSSDSVNRLRDTIDLGSISMPLQLLDAIQNHHLSPYATADIHKEGVVIDSVRYVDSHPCDTTLDIPGIIATSSHVGAAILLSQCNPDNHGYIFKRKTTMMDVADDYCRIADDINRPLHDRNMDMIQQGLHKVVWDNNIGTASVRQWDGRIMAYKAQSDSIHIAGKTGSAQIYRDGFYHANEHRLSFVGYFPEEAPRYCCLVVVESPAQGLGYDAGSMCGGTVRRIAERIYLQ